MHDFKFKMLYYYDLLSLVMWAYTCKPRVFKNYKDYAVPVKAKDIKLKALREYEANKATKETKATKTSKEVIDDPPDPSERATSGVINILKTALGRSSNTWVPSEFREGFERTVSESLELFNGKKKKRRARPTKVSAKLLPIGHYISEFPRIYHPEKGWEEDPLYRQHDQGFVENDTIIGYNDKSKTGVHVRFKIRNPIHNIKKFQDSRMIERGTVCASKSKKYLWTVAEKLGIVMPDKMNVSELCGLIRSKLIRLELKERVAGTNIKWFYWHYEEQLPQ
jgi:hypothetical protein